MSKIRAISVSVIMGFMLLLPTGCDPSAEPKPGPKQTTGAVEGDRPACERTKAAVNSGTLSSPDVRRRIYDAGRRDPNSFVRKHSEYLLMQPPGGGDISKWWFDNALQILSNCRASGWNG